MHHIIELARRGINLIEGRARAGGERNHDGGRSNRELYVRLCKQIAGIIEGEDSHALQSMFA